MSTTWQGLEKQDYKFKKNLKGTTLLPWAYIWYKPTHNLMQIDSDIG